MSKKVLLIEDEEGIANAFKKQLELIGGYIVTWYDKAQIALEALKKDEFSVILLDLVMPEVDGIAFLKEFRKPENKYKQVPVIILTNVTSDEIKKEVEEFHINKFIIKTDIVPNDLISAIEEITK